MSETHEDITGIRMMPDKIRGDVGELNLWGNKIIENKEATGQQVVEYGVITLKNGEIIQLSYVDYERLTAFMDNGGKGMMKFHEGLTSVDTVMIGKMETKRRLEDAPIDLKKYKVDKHLKRRVLQKYEVETNDGKGWYTKDMFPEDGDKIIALLRAGDEETRKHYRQLIPYYSMEYVIENKEGKELRVERKLDHQYPRIPLTRYDENGREVVRWYWAMLSDPKTKAIGFKKVVQLTYDETKGDYVQASMLDRCSQEQIDILNRRGY